MQTVHTNSSVLLFLSYFWTGITENQWDIIPRCSIINPFQMLIEGSCYIFCLFFVGQCIFIIVILMKMFSFLILYLFILNCLENFVCSFLCKQFHSELPVHIWFAIIQTSRCLMSLVLSPSPLVPWIVVITILYIYILLSIAVWIHSLLIILTEFYFLLH